MKLELENMSINYRINKFNEDDIPEIYEFCKKNTTYYKYMKMQPTYENLKEVLTCLPPNKTIEDKFFVGFYKNDCLIAILDLITKYPNDDTAFIGWFMINKDYQGLGIGTKIANELFDFLKSEGFNSVRLGYVKDNIESKSFWIKNGFEPTGMEGKDDNYSFVLMQRDL